MKVSVVVPVYNVSAYIGDCLRSVLSQTYQNLEVVLVDDCGTDNSMSVAQEVLRLYGKTCEVKILRHERNRGLSAARNTGLEHSTGDYVYFLDSDDEITPDCLERLVRAAEGVMPDMVVGDYEVRNSCAFFPQLKLGDGLLRGHESIVREYMEENIYVMAWNKLVRKDFLLERKIFFKERLIHEDCLWSFICACEAETLAVVKYPTYIYKVRENSIKSATGQQEDVRSLMEVLEGMVDYVSRRGLWDNRYVYSFLEEEKVRFLNICKSYGWEKELFLLRYYDRLVGMTQVRPFRIFCWSCFKSKKCIRDAHYFLPSGLRSEFYWKLPYFLGQGKTTVSGFMYGFSLPC